MRLNRKRTKKNGSWKNDFIRLDSAVMHNVTEHPIWCDSIMCKCYYAWQWYGTLRLHTNILAPVNVQTMAMYGKRTATIIYIALIVIMLGADNNNNNNKTSSEKVKDLILLFFLRKRKYKKHYLQFWLFKIELIYVNNSHSSRQ